MHVAEQGVDYRLLFAEDGVAVYCVISPHPKVIPPLLIRNHLLTLLQEFFILFRADQLEVLRIVFCQDGLLEGVLHVADDDVLARQLHILLDVVDCVLHRAGLGTLHLLLRQAEALDGLGGELVHVVGSFGVGDGLDEGADQSLAHAGLRGGLGHTLDFQQVRVEVLQNQLVLKSRPIDPRALDIAAQPVLICALGSYLITQYLVLVDVVHRGA